MSEELTLEKLKIVEQLQNIAQSQAIMKEQMNSFSKIHEGVQKILDRHDLMLLGDGSPSHIGISSRMKTLEDDMIERSTHTKWVWTAIIASFLEHLRHMLLGGK